MLLPLSVVFAAVIYLITGYCLARMRVRWAWHVADTWFVGYSGREKIMSVHRQFLAMTLLWPIYAPFSYTRQFIVNYNKQTTSALKTVKRAYISARNAASNHFREITARRTP